MAIYEFKEFLAIDDVADYLTDKGVYEFYLSYENDYRKLKNFIKELYQSDKITPVFYCDISLLKIHQIHGLEKEIEPPTMVGFRYFICNYDMMKAFFDSSPIYANFCVGDSKIFYQLYQDTSPYYIYIADGNENDFEVDILFPKSQLDTLFLQHQKDHPQSQISTINHQLNETNERTENSYLTTIGILLELLKTPKGFDKDNKPNKPLFDSNAQIIQQITNLAIYGQGKSTLENRFARANEALDQAKKK